MQRHGMSNEEGEEHDGEGQEDGGRGGGRGC